MRILGIDPGSRLTGVAIIDGGIDTSRSVYHGVIRTPEGEHSQRLGVIFQELSEIIRIYQPRQGAIESVFVSRNVMSALKLGQARGAAMCAMVVSGLDVTEYAPKAIKLAVVGRGGADKAQVQHMVRMLLSLSEEPSTDAADALAVALCHHHHQQTQARLAGA